MYRAIVHKKWRTCAWNGCIALSLFGVALTDAPCGCAQHKLMTQTSGFFLGCTWKISRIWLGGPQQKACKNKDGRNHARDHATCIHNMVMESSGNGLCLPCSQIQDQVETHVGRNVGIRLAIGMASYGEVSMTWGVRSMIGTEKNLPPMTLTGRVSSR